MRMQRRLERLKTDRPTLMAGAAGGGLSLAFFPGHGPRAPRRGMDGRPMAFAVCCRFAAPAGAASREAPLVGSGK